MNRTYRRKQSGDARALELLAEARQMAVEVQCLTGRRKLDALRDLANQVSEAHFACLRAVKEHIKREGDR